MHARGVVGQNHPEHGRLGLEAQGHAARFNAVAAGQHGQVQSTRQGVENRGQILQHELVLGHIGPAHVLREAGRRRLQLDEVRGRHGSVAQRQRGFHEELGRLLHLGQQLRRRHLPQHGPRPRRMTHVAFDQSAIRPGHLGQLLPGRKVDDGIHVEALIGLAETQYR